MDPPDRTLQGEVQMAPYAHAPLQHGDHVLFFDPTDKPSLIGGCRGGDCYDDNENDDGGVLGQLLDGPLVERYRLAKRGHLYAMRHHRAVSRIDGAFVALSQIWAQWSNGR